MERQRIYNIKSNALNEDNRLELSRLLIKAGYAVRIGKERKSNSKTYIHFVEYWEEN